MTLIKSISGIRGTIGGSPEDGLNPLAIVKFVAAYATFIRKNTKVETNKIVVGRDARISGPMVKTSRPRNAYRHGIRCGGYRSGHDSYYRIGRSYGRGLRRYYPYRQS